MNAIRDELFRVLSELSALCPDVRVGQLVVNLSYHARGMAHESIWDMEDEELLDAARKQLLPFKARQAQESKDHYAPATDPVEQFIGGATSDAPDWADQHDQHLGQTLLRDMRVEGGAMK